MWSQAAAAAGKDYVWAVDTGMDGPGSGLFARLLTVIDGCLVPEPTHRLTVPHVLESLTTLQRDVAGAASPTGGGSGSVAGAGGSVASGIYASSVAVPSQPVSATPVYDVMAIVSAMEALKIDATAVIDAIGGKSASSLEALRTVGVPFGNAMAVRRALIATAGAASVSATPTRVLVDIHAVAF